MPTTEQRRTYMREYMRARRAGRVRKPRQIKTSSERKATKRCCQLRASYGITLRQYNDLLRQQEGLCPVCGGPGPTHVDHDHATGKVRGILHSSCNLMLGHAHDSIPTLQRAIAYLEHHGRTS